MPVATAFGDWDGETRLGMLRREELSLLVRSHQPSSSAPPNEQGVNLNNSRGDVRSRTAALHSALGVRLYALTDYVIDHRLSHAAWPAWNAQLKQVLNASEEMKQRALFRLPRIYRYAVRYLIYAAIVTDTFILGARAGRMLKHAFLTAAAAAGDGEASDWRTFAWFGASMLFVFNLLAAYFVLLLVQGLSNMEQPFDTEMNSMPGLSYVCAAAEMSLRAVACDPAGSAPARRGSMDALAALNGGVAASTEQEEASRPVNIMSLLQHLDEDHLIHKGDEVKPAIEPTMAPRVRRKASVPSLTPCPSVMGLGGLLARAPSGTVDAPPLDAPLVV